MTGNGASLSRANLYQAAVVSPNQVNSDLTLNRVLENRQDLNMNESVLKDYCEDVLLFLGELFEHNMNIQLSKFKSDF